jgi:lactoylglutathione lyase
MNNRLRAVLDMTSTLTMIAAATGFTACEGAPMKKLNHSALLLPVLLVLSGIWIGCGTGSVDPPPASTGSIAGLVQEEGIQTPLSGIQVYLGTAQTSTDQGGRFEFRDIPVAQSLLIRTEAEHFDPYSEQIVVQDENNEVNILLQRRVFEFQFDRTGIAVSDMDRSVDFYEGILRLTVSEHAVETDRPTRSYALGSDIVLHVLETQDVISAPVKYRHLAISVRDFDATLNSLDSQGVEYSDFAGTVGQVLMRPDGVRQIYLQDPDGNWLKLTDLLSANQDVDTSFEHQNVLVKDAEPNVSFYREMLQFGSLPSPWGPSSPVRFLSMGANQELHVAQYDLSGSKSKDLHMGFSTEHFDAFLRFMDRKGTVYGNYAGEVGQVDERQDGLRQVYFQDPDGNWIEVHDGSSPLI